MEFNIYSLLVDLMWASIFLFAAKLLREKIKILQSLFVPVSLLAGFIGLWWLKLAIPASAQEVGPEEQSFKVILSYIVNSSSAWICREKP